MVLNENFLNALLATNTPSGYEEDGVNAFNDYCSTFANHIYCDAVGNSAFAVGDGEIPFLISAHIDEIAMQVQNIDDKGFIHFIKDGGIDPKALLGSNVTILSDNHRIKGVIGKTPIHIESRSEEKDKATKIKDMKIDCGFSSKEEALEYISIGDAIVVDAPITQLGVHRLASKALDDKIGVFICAEVLKELAKKHTLKKLKVIAGACVQEEVGAIGASILAKNLNPKYSIDYDVTFATDDGYVSADEWGDVKLGNGGCIAYGPDKNHKFCKLIKGVCIDNKIPFQEFSVHGGTDTETIKKNSSDCETALLSISIRNMHTQAEVVDMRDVKSIVDMTVATILKLDSELN